MPLDPEYVAIADARLAEEAGLAAVGLGICWPNTSPFGSGTAIPVLAGETLGEAADRLALRWAPRWLLDAGFEASDAAGQATSDTQAATVTGPISWTPEVRTCRVEDQIANTTAAGTPRYERRLAGEVALLGLWHQAAQASGLDDVRPEGDLDGNTRGTRFRDFLVHLLKREPPAGMGRSTRGPADLDTWPSHAPRCRWPEERHRRDRRWRTARRRRLLEVDMAV